MKKRPLDLQIFPAFRSAVSRNWLRKLTAEALHVADPLGTKGVSLVIADDETLRALNRTHRGYNVITDVLSFSHIHSANDASADFRIPSNEESIFPSITEEEEYIGEVVISYPQALRQAPGNGQAIERELALLVVHGILHLFGHDHAGKNETKIMRELERTALAAIF